MSIPFLRPGARRGGPLAPAAAPPPPPPPRGPQAAPTAPAPAPRAWRLSSFSAPFPTLVFAPPLRPQREGRRRTSGPARPPPSLPPSRFRPPAAPSAAAQPQNIAQKQPAPPPNEGTPASPGTRPPRRAAHKSRPLTHAHGERRLPKNTRAACFPPPAPVWPLHNAGTGGGNRWAAAGFGGGAALAWVGLKAQQAPWAIRAPCETPWPPSAPLPPIPPIPPLQAAAPAPAQRRNGPAFTQASFRASYTPHSTAMGRPWSAQPPSHEVWDITRRACRSNSWGSTR